MKGLKIVLAVMLFAALLDMPYGYYQLLRFVATLSFVYLAYQAGASGAAPQWVWVYGALALLFQPVFKIALGREIWNVVDVIVAIGLLATRSQGEDQKPPPHERG